MAKVSKHTGKIQQQDFNRLVLFALILPPLFISPWISFDPLNLPRMLLLSAIGCSAIFLIIRFLIIQSGFKVLSNLHRMLIFSASLFALAILNTWIFSGADLTRQFYGAFGRNNGVLTYIGLIVILIMSSLSRIELSQRWLFRALYIVGILNVFYGYIQFLDLDPVRWRNPYGRVIGTLGNPNFMSSFLGLFGVFILFQVLYSFKCNIRSRAIHVLFLITILNLIWKSGSIQGLLVFLSGILVLLFLYFEIYKSKVHTFFVLTAILLIGIPLLFGFFGKGLFGNFLYQETLRIRVYFWLAAIRMLAQNPIHGLGMDSFGNWYLRYRGEDAALFNPNVSADMAHNVLLDFGAWGGFPMMLSWLMIILIITIACLGYLKNQNKLNSNFSLFAAMSIGYLAQSLVSINELTLAFFGYTFLGLLFASTQEHQTFDGIRRENANAYLALPLIFVLGLAVALPAFLADANFRKSVLLQDGTALISAVNRWPQNDTYIMFVAEIFHSNGYEKDAVKLSYDALKVNSNNLKAIRLLYNSELTSENEKAILKQKIKYVDPWREI